MSTKLGLAVIISLIMSIFMAILSYHQDYVAIGAFIVLWGACIYNIYKPKP